MINRTIVVKLLCVALVAAIMMPAGQMIFPHVEGLIGGLPFETIEAILSASLGFGLYAAIFG